MSIWRWIDRLPAVPASKRISLGEGSTPLIPSRSIGPRAGLDRLMFKWEAINPTGSYKDRFAACAISGMQAAGQTDCWATSSGNTGSALAAYAAAAGIRCRIAVVETAPRAKLLQMLAYGAELFYVRGFGLDPQITEQTFASVRQRGQQPGCALQISAFSFSPLGMAGIKTIAYELAEQTAGSMDHLFSPAGGGGLTLGIARGFKELVQAGQLARTPRIHCVQPEGNNTIAGPLRQGNDRATEVHCRTRISGLQVPNVIDGHETIAACRDTGGTGYSVSDAEVFEVQQRLVREEGIFSEPAGAAALAGALRAAQLREIDAGDAVVCLVTGSGFKDLSALEEMTLGTEIPCRELADI